MREKSILLKWYWTSILLFSIFTLYTIPSLQNTKVLRTNLEIKEPFPELFQRIYLLNKDGFLVRCEVILENKENLEKVEDIIEYLKMDSSEGPSSLMGYLPNELVVLEKTQNEDTFILNVSKEWEEVEEDEKSLAGVIYSLLELEEIEKVKILIEGSLSKKYPDAFDKTFGINKEFPLSHRREIQKVFLYYYDKENYLLPVTRYVNDEREKVEVIIEELKKGTPNEISYLKEKATLLDFKEEENVFYLNFNQDFYDLSSSIQDKVVESIAESVFQNYEVDSVIFAIEGKISHSVIQR